jgi:hypothetical protein
MGYVVGIEFETDDSALQSILDETGIQYVQPQHGNQPQMSKFSRHTLAAVPKVNLLSKFKSQGWVQSNWFKLQSLIDLAVSIFDQIDKDHHHNL